MVEDTVCSKSIDEIAHTKSTFSENIILISSDRGLQQAVEGNLNPYLPGQIAISAN
jgi:hypothetical protein